MSLDELENDTTPRFTRQIAHEPKEGYVWNPLLGIYEEGDLLFRSRILAASVPADPMVALLTRMRELGIPEIVEEHIELWHFRLIVDDAYVEATKQLVYDCVPIICRVDVIGKNSRENHEWCGPMGTETTAPDDDTNKPNHVRDAVRANP